MPSEPRVTDEERGRIKGFDAAGWSNRAVVHNVGRSDRTVACIVAPEAPMDPKELGPHPVMPEREVRLMVRKAVTGDFTESRLKEHVNSSAFQRTIQRLLANVDWLQYPKMDNTLDLTPAHKLAQREFAKEWLLYSKDVWPNGILSD